MKNNRQSSSRSMNEREKLRMFRELDDALASALRDLGGGDADSQDASPSTPSFEERLHDLMQEYQLSSRNVATLLRTIVELRQAQ